MVHHSRYYSLSSSCDELVFRGNIPYSVAPSKCLDRRYNMLLKLPVKDHFELNSKSRKYMEEASRLTADKNPNIASLDTFFSQIFLGSSVINGVLVFFSKQFDETKDKIYMNELDENEYFLLLSITGANCILASPFKKDIPIDES